jgi:Domain of unknown function (DUF4926)
MSPGSPRRTSSATGRRRTRRFRALERVQLRRDLPEHGLKRGECGTVVHVFETAEAYLVEFVSPADGSTRALAELTPDHLGPVAEA